MEIRVAVADLKVAGAESVLTTIGLGSCVAIALHDVASKIGGLAHILLPSQALSREQSNIAKFPQTAIPAMLEQMRALGATGKTVAKIAGGASMFGSLLPAGGVHMGERNVEATRRVLRELGIPLMSQDVGGDYGRTVFFHTGDGRLVVRSLRAGERVI
jgi:chemotaxis protein CheD